MILTEIKNNNILLTPDALSGNLNLGRCISINELTLNSFFCGAGGIDIGFIQEGWNVLAAWDIDKHAVQSYNANVGNHAQVADIREMKWNDIPPALAWTFGSPCTTVSIAGQKDGIILICNNCECEYDIKEHTLCPRCGNETNKGATTESGLIYEVFRLLDETQKNTPENMPMYLMAENVGGLKHYIGIIEKEFSQRGYSFYYDIYNAENFGLPQRRKRYFIAGIRENEKEYRIPDTQILHTPPSLSSFLDQEVEKKYYIDDDKAEMIIAEARKRTELEQVHACLTPKRVNKRQMGRRCRPNEEPMFTITATDKHGVIIFENGRYRVRLLTPLEAGKFQGFPVHRWKQCVNECYLYKQFGNALPIPIAQAFGASMKYHYLKTKNKNQHALLC